MTAFMSVSDAGLEGLLLAARRQLVQAERSVTIQTSQLVSAEWQYATAAAEVQKWVAAISERGGTA